MEQPEVSHDRRALGGYQGLNEDPLFFVVVLFVLFRNPSNIGSVHKQKNRRRQEHGSGESE